MSTLICSECGKEVEGRSNAYAPICRACNAAEDALYRAVEQTPLCRLPHRYSKSAMKERLGVNHESEL